MRDLVMLLRPNGRSGLVAILVAAALLFFLLLPVHDLLKDQVTIHRRLLMGRSPPEIDATATCSDYISARVPLFRIATSGAASASSELRLALASAAANVSRGVSLARVAYETIDALKGFAIGAADAADGVAPLRAVSACLGVPFEDARRMHAALSSVAANSHRQVYVRVLSPPDCAPGTREVIVVHSPPAAAERRQLIRDAWSSGRLVDRQFRLVFAVGRAAAAASERDLAAEHASHDDILAHDFVDDYYHLPLKTLLAMQWVSERCSLAAYMVKADDDVYINPQNLHVLLLARPPNERKIIGNIGRGMQPHRSLESKWYVPGDAFSGAEYPAFAFSPCYVVSVAVLRDLIASCKRLPYLYLEDVFVTGLCAAGDIASPVEHESAPSFLASSCEEFPDPVAVQLLDRPYARCGA